jgi:hypothetical protein
MKSGPIQIFGRSDGDLKLAVRSYKSVTVIGFGRNRIPWGFVHEMKSL